VCVGEYWSFDVSVVHIFEELSDFCDYQFGVDSQGTIVSRAVVIKDALGHVVRCGFILDCKPDLLL